MTNQPALSLALLASLAAVGCKDRSPTAPAAAAKAVEPVAAPVPAAAPSGKLAAAITAVNACKPDDDCAAMEQLEDASQDLGPAEYRGAMALAKNKDARRELSGAVAGKLDEPLLRELEQASDACKPDDDCPAEDDLSAAIGELSPALFRAGMKAARTVRTRRDLLDAIRPKMDASLIPEIAPLIVDADVGDDAQLALGAIEDTGALAQLAALLDRHDRTDTIHSRVPDLLAKYPDNPSVKAALPKLRAMAKNDAQGVGKAEAAVAVGKIEGAAAVPFLVDYIAGETWGPARAMATEELATFKTNAVALATLKKLAKDSDHDVSDAAGKALH